ncbi:SDR family oxidoreductase [Cyanobium sp. NIES-981]|uniref:SDR family oxidoreductase n=1 Tax=Cyanobium sp. NIES-981 TaxID=1851505 RepID=UPI0007DD9090|nr:SDR family oxidoreductase [Cyanobium sp. NIES-981]SBO44083.1 NAD dependent epimerase/dehydratase [Cyanobium sp. NIES-981]
METISSDTGVLVPDGAVKPVGRLLVVGAGYTGQRLATAAARQGFEVVQTSRQPSPGGAASRWLPFDSQRGLVPGSADLKGITHLFVSVPPDGQGGDPVVRLLGARLRDLPLVWAGYLSTTGVYGDTAGAWVDETAPTPARPGRSQARLEAEQAWLASGLPLQIFRLPAIYGPGRTPFQALRSGTSRLIHKPGQVFSRIHVDDIVGAVLHCLALPAGQRPTLLNVADDEPSASSETLGYAAHLLGCRLPPLERYDSIEASLSPMARSFWQENRRVSNRRLCEELGYRLRYPTYREGYRACISSAYGEPLG